MRVFACFAALLAAPVAAAQSLADLAFLEGEWRGRQDALAFEEIWSAPGGGVITGMARGERDGALAVLEYIVIAEEDAGVMMRFKHFNADYTTWETEGPVVLRFVEAKENDALFRADDPMAEVQSARYWMPTPTTLQADIALLRDGKPGGFTLLFARE